MAAASPGRGEDVTPQTCDEAADIRYLSVGFWRRSAKPAPLSFLVLHSSEKFVLLAEEPWAGQQVIPVSSPFWKVVICLQIPLANTYKLYSGPHQTVV